MSCSTFLLLSHQFERLKLFFPKGGTHYTNLPFRMPSSHAALMLALKGLTAARQISFFFSSLLEKIIIQNDYALVANLCLGCFGCKHKR